ncbi:hypothetical protein KY331_02205 [Candidatus Woesearchaeota archaeon]|nr:hypothetical protein [Candidatus Woesearchaeota archaeon]
MKKIILCLIFIGILCSSFVFAVVPLGWNYDEGLDAVILFVEAELPPEVEPWGVDWTMYDSEDSVLDSGQTAFNDLTNDDDISTVTIDLVDPANKLEAKLIEGEPDFSPFGDPLFLGLGGSNGGPVYQIPEFSNYSIVVALLIIAAVVVALYMKKKKQITTY